MLSAPALRPHFQPPVKRRRTATGVLAGYFDPRPHRDVLTSLLNGVGPYRLVEGDEEERRLKRRERKEQEKRERKMKKLQQRPDRADPVRKPLAQSQPAAGPSVVIPSESGRVPAVNSSTSSFWRSQRPPVLATRSVSPTPPPELSPPSTPDPSATSTVSYDSSKRPHTPDDGFSFIDALPNVTPEPQAPRVRRKRQAARKGWKGWVEGSPPPSDKLINLDAVPIMVERRLRSGKNFDAISEGADTWVKFGPEH